MGKNIKKERKEKSSNKLNLKQWTWWFPVCVTARLPLQHFGICLCISEHPELVLKVKLKAALLVFGPKKNKKNSLGILKRFGLNAENQPSWLQLNLQDCDDLDD